MLARMTMLVRRQLLLLPLLSLASASCARSTPPPVAPATATATAMAPATATAPAATASEPTAPVAKRVPHPATLHGVTLADDYFWLRGKGTPEVESYLKAENAYTTTTMQPTATLQQTLYEEMLARIQETDVTVPYRRLGYFYYSRTVEGLQYPIICRKSAKGAARRSHRRHRHGARGGDARPQRDGQDAQVRGLGASVVSDDGSCTPTRSTPPASASTRCASRPRRLADVQRGDPARRRRRVGERQPHRVLRHRGRDGQAALSTLSPRRRQRPGQRHAGLRGEGRVLRAEAGAHALPRLAGATSESKTTTEMRVARADSPAGEWRVVEPRQHDVTITSTTTGHRSTSAPMRRRRRARQERATSGW